MDNSSLPALIYVRSATMGSMDDQIQECAKYADDNGLRIVGIFQDPGFGFGGRAAPGMQALLAQAQSSRYRRFVLVVVGLSRLSRISEECLDLARSVEALGGEIHTTAGGCHDIAFECILQAGSDNIRKLRGARRTGRK